MNPIEDTELWVPDYDDSGHIVGASLLRDAVNRFEGSPGLENSVWELDKLFEIGDDPYRFVYTWNESPGEIPRISDYIRQSMPDSVSITGLGDYEAAEIQNDLLEQERGRIQELIDQRQEPSPSDLRGSVDQLEGVYRDYLLLPTLPKDGQPSSSSHAIRLSWNTEDGKEFDTLLIVGDSYPYLSDTMFLSVIVEQAENSCIDIRLDWIWGTPRGRIFFNIHPVGNKCSMHEPTAPIAHLDLGTAELYFKEGSIVYDGDANTCSVIYKYAYASPMVRISFDKKGFKIEASGLGTRSISDAIPCVK